MPFFHKYLFKDHQHFFSKNFEVSLSFNKKGGLDGVLTHVTDSIAFQQNLNGLYVMGEFNVKIAFMVEWSDPNVINKVLTCFSGVIMPRSRGKNLLVLTFMQISDSPCGVGSFTERNSDVLFDSRDQDNPDAVEKILRSFATGSFN
jgi:hypothetical protein